MTTSTKLKPTDPLLLVPQISTKRKKPLQIHPWQVIIKDNNSNKIMRAHNSVKNPVYPKPKEKRKPLPNRIIFTVIGNRITKEFIYCVKMVLGMHKYRWQTYGPPIIKGVTGLEWPLILNELKVNHGDTAFCLRGQVAVLYNDNFLGGEKELKDLIEERYIYHLTLNYPKESIDLFRHFIKSTGRACAYMHISIEDEPIGCLVFMLYSDIVPHTCENFLRLCQTTKGGYSGTPVHRIVEGGWIQCGGFGLKDTPLGCENFIVPHDRRGVLGMCNIDRGIDCSTQFFVLLQPALWMTHKYVAFGQLIEGKETLQKIEAVPTFYESPTKNIIINKAGILNMECDSIMINRGAVAYIDGHIEELVSLGEMLYEWLMEYVALEIQFRYLQSLEPQGSEEESFQQINSITQSLSSKKGPNENNDFDVEDYQLNEFEEETHHHVEQHTVSSSEAIQKRLYYVPLADVPYPEEKDSNFDLKRFLQGDYCLQADLDPKQSKIVDTSLMKLEKEISDVMESYRQSNVLGTDDNASVQSDDVDYSDEEKETTYPYPREDLEEVSIAGEVFRTVARKFAKDNPFQELRRETFTEEEVRRIRLALQDLKSRETRQVALV